MQNCKSTAHKMESLADLETCRVLVLHEQIAVPGAKAFPQPSRQHLSGGLVSKSPSLLVMVGTLARESASRNSIETSGSG